MPAAPGRRRCGTATSGCSMGPRHLSLTRPWAMRRCWWRGPPPRAATTESRPSSCHSTVRASSPGKKENKLGMRASDTSSLGARRLPDSLRLSPRQRGRRIRPGDEGPRRRPHLHRRPVRGHCPRRPRRGPQLRHRPRAVRQADLLLPAHPGQARRYGDQRGCGAAAHPALGRHEGRRA